MNSNNERGFIEETKPKININNNNNEYSLKKGIFNPSNSSPNNFIRNLERRIEFYYLKCQLEKDILTLDIK